MTSALSMLADHTLFSELSLSSCFIFLLPLCWMHITKRLAGEGLVHRKCPVGRLESHCKLQSLLEITFLGSSHERKALNHFGSDCTFTWAFRDDNPSFIISLPCPSSENVLCSVGKDQEATTANTGLTQLPDKLTCETAARRKAVLRGRETEASACVRCFTTVEVPVPRVSILLTFPPPAECLMLSLEPHRDWISLKSIFLFKILT